MGRGYLRFSSLHISVQTSAGPFSTSISRGGPSRVEIVFEGTGDAPDVAIAEEAAARLHGLIVVFCQAPIVDFELGSTFTQDADGSPHHYAYARALGGSTRDASVLVPFEHMTDMPAEEIAELEAVLQRADAIRQTLVESVQHSLTRAEGNVEAFLADYAVLESVLGGRQAAVDSFIREREPEVEMTADSRGKPITIYTKLRNAKGHPTNMPHAEASILMQNLLPRLRMHVRAALIRDALE